MAAVKTLPLDYELVIYGGATFRREFRWLPDGSAALDFTLWSASMMIGVPQNATPLIELSTANGDITLSTGGQIIITIGAADTAALPAGVLSYSLDLTQPDGDVLRFLRGRVSVVTDVGRSV